eukprot:TRINITY_DN235_c3_g1_i1.p1 TRINITY_DN235_c3_g1~~TRINITY_DN235_c3_g1_i1.p1  ORF type:complete len:529 (-),score=142.43 TRINITY_DN235_c3_g1_i1:146-1732(-)
MAPPPSPIRNEAFLKDIEKTVSQISFEDQDRLNHAHGHTCAEIYTLRYGQFQRFPDVVVWPGCHDHVEVIVAAAQRHNVCIIPFGGGTSVTEALLCPAGEKRMIVSLDMHDMNAIKWIDEESMLMRVEAGVVGMDLESRLAPMGLCLGHEPDSYEFSTMGGWIATRASGMKKNVYGNIEDMVVSIALVTTQGTLEKGCQVPRMSCGPDLHHVILGSEGTLGVITEATVRLRPIAEKKTFGSIVFPDFEGGVAAMHEIAMKRTAPASIRLVDNKQFKFGQALQPEDDSRFGFLTQQLKRLYVTKWKGFNIDTMTAATCVFEGDADVVALQQKNVYAIAAKYGGIPGGEENGQRGYFLTYMIAYLRDLSFKYHFIAESFETSVPWSNVLPLCEAVKKQVHESCVRHGVTTLPFVSTRVTQTYDTGAAVYVYFGFLYKGIEDPVACFEAIEEEARDRIMELGGCISHHHGIGKVRKQWVEETVSPTGLQLLKGIKQTIDPSNIFVTQNLFDVNENAEDDEEAESDAVVDDE